MITPTWAVCRVPHPDAPSLADLVREPAGFVAETLFRDTCRTTRAEAGRDPATFTTVEHLWSDVLTRHARTPMFRLVRDGETLAPSMYCRSAGVGHRTITDVIQPNRVVELYRSGATMVLQGLQLTDPHLGRFANNLALELDHPVQVNAYLSPEAAKGLELHFDFHDVFVVQLEGRKRWRTWRPLERTRNPVRGDAAPAMPTFDELGDPAFDLVLQAGDCLYLPRGFPHCAETIEAASAHLTVGVMAVTWQRLVRQVLDGVGADDTLTASVAAASLGAPFGPQPELAALEKLVDPHALRAWMADEIWRRQPATRLAPFAAPAVPGDRPIVVTPGPLLWLTSTPDPDRVRVGLGDRHLDLPVEATPFLTALLSSPGGFVAADWPGDLDQASRQVVLDRLAAEGVVVAG